MSKMVSTRVLLLSEQIISSVLNFCLVVFLSREGEREVASFGLIYSFALVYAALLKNGALNIYLTSGSQSLTALHRLIQHVVYNRWHFLGLAIIGALTIWQAGVWFIFVFIYYALVDVYKTYLIAVNRFTENLLIICGLGLTLIVLYQLDLSLIFAFSIVTFILLFRYLFELNRDGDLSKLSPPDQINRDSFILTVAYTSYAHGPLWLLYAIDSSYAALFVQIRNLFQPAQIFSRVLDIFEKRASSKVGSFFENFKRVFWVQTVTLTGVTIVLAVVGYLVFPLLYQSTPNFLTQLIFWYSMVCIGTFISRPIETYFYGTRRLDVLVKSRIIGCFVFVLLAIAVLLVPQANPLVFMLAGLSVVWMCINGINLYSISNR